MSRDHHLGVGDEVVVDVGEGREYDTGGGMASSGTTSGVQGVVRYVGRVDFSAGVWLGIELDTGRGRNDGSVAGRRYFECAPRHGLFLKSYSPSVRLAPASREEMRSRGAEAYRRAPGHEPLSPRAERREAAAATRLQRSYRGMRDRSSVGPTLSVSVLRADPAVVCSTESSRGWKHGMSSICTTKLIS